jgi:hypothetical protein
MAVKAEVKTKIVMRIIHHLQAQLVVNMVTGKIGNSAQSLAVVELKHELEI